MFWHATYEIARKEVLQNLRTKRLLGVGITVVLAMVLVTLLLPSFIGTEFVSFLFPGDVVLANGIIGFFLENPLFIFSGIFLFQLMALLLTGDSVASEWDRRTIFLILSKPVPRSAFVLGKYLGVSISIGGFAVLTILLDYVLLIMIHGAPGAEGFLRFAIGLGLVVLGMLAYAAIALLFSTLTRSAVTSTLLSIVAWVIIFPLIAQLDFFIALARFGFEGAAGGANVGMGWSQYLSPGPSMRESGTVLAANLNTSIAKDAGNAALALLGHIVVWVGLAFLVVKRRNFE